MGTKLSILAITLAVACKAAESDKIRSVVEALNKARAQHDSKAFRLLFTPDAVGTALQQPEIWSETSTPSIQIQSIRFPSRNVALVDAVENQYGSVILKQSVPVTLSLKRSREGWRITSLRVVRASP